MGAYTSGADVAPYISNRADFQRLQDTIATAFAPKTKVEVSETAKINKKFLQAAEARVAGNEKKALRKERAAQRKAARLAKTTLKFMQPKDNGNDKIDSTIISFKDKPSFSLNYEIPTNVGLNYEIPTKKE